MERGKYPLKATEYALVDEIGRGGGGVVYKALCLPLGTVVAIKVMSLDEEYARLEAMTKETAFMGTLSHPNLLTSYGSFVEGEVLWVIIPYMEGGSCDYIMKDSFPNGLKENVVATILRDTLKALAYLHQSCIMHRDIKAANILIDEHGTVKLADYGVAVSMIVSGDKVRRRDSFVGTKSWMAPEVWSMKSGYDDRADIWSFGMTALELAEGRNPYSILSQDQMLRKVSSGVSPTLSKSKEKEFSKTFKDMLAQCLQRVPGQRPSAERLLKHPFFKLGRNNEYICSRVLQGLDPLAVRVKRQREKEIMALKQSGIKVEDNKGKKEEVQTKISAWLFDVDELKAQASMIEDEETEEKKIKDEKLASSSSGNNEETSKKQTPSSGQPISTEMSANEDIQPHLDPSNLIRNEKETLGNERKVKQIGRFKVIEGIDSEEWTTMTSKHSQQCSMDTGNSQNRRASQQRGLTRSSSYFLEKREKMAVDAKRSEKRNSSVNERILSSSIGGQVEPALFRLSAMASILGHKLSGKGHSGSSGPSIPISLLRPHVQKVFQQLRDVQDSVSSIISMIISKQNLPQDNDPDHAESSQISNENEKYQAENAKYSEIIKALESRNLDLANQLQAMQLRVAQHEDQLNKIQMEKKHLEAS